MLLNLRRVACNVGLFKLLSDSCIMLLIDRMIIDEIKSNYFIHSSFISVLLSLYYVPIGDFSTQRNLATN